MTELKHLDGIDVSPEWVDGVHWPTFKMDNSSGLLFARQLEHVQNKAYEVKLPGLKAREVFGTNHEYPAGAETASYYAYDAQGDFELITDYRKDFHAISANGSKESNSFESFGALVVYSIQDIRAAEMAGIALNSIQVSAARRMWEQRLEAVAINGYKQSNVTGLMNAPGVTQTVSGAAFAGLSGQALYDLIADMITDMSDSTGGGETASNVYMPLTVWNAIIRKNLSASYKRTVRDALVEDFGVQLDSWVSLKGVAAGGKDAIVVMNKSPENFELAISQEFELGTPQQENMAFSMTAHGRTAGLIVRYPKSISIVTDA